MYTKFVNSSFEHEINNIVLPSIFPSMIDSHIKILSEYVVKLINNIAMCFIFDDETYIYQLKQNNYQDIKWLTYLLLPFLNEINDVTQIKSLNDIYVKKKENCNINESEPKYLYSNMQYNICNRTPNNYEEKQFTIEMLNHNYYLLLHTIKTMSHKMHVNWIDIFPITMQDIKNTTLYINTLEYIRNGTIYDWDPFTDSSLSLSDHDLAKYDIQTKLTCLQVNDIYNTMSIYLFDEIVHIKWLLYDVISLNKAYPQIVILNELFVLDDCLAGVSWEQLSSDRKLYFKTAWKSVIDIAKSNNSITYGDIQLTNESVKSLLKSIIMFFCLKSRYVDDAVEEGFIKISDTLEEEVDEDNSITFEHVFPSLESVSPKYIYQYFSDVLSAFKNTWYGTKILTDNKTQVRKFEYFSRINNINITYKNIYNFAKSFCYHKEYTVPGDKKSSIFVRYPKYWEMLNKEQRSVILKRINNKDGSFDWFDISRYIVKLKLPMYTGLSVVELNNEIFKQMHEIFGDIIFQTLITKGLLTQFVPNKEKTDSTFVKRDNIYTLQEDIFAESDSNKYWTSAYHYLTLLPYNKMEDFATREKKYNYFSLAKNKKYQWYTAYSYDWVAQISFCHHFINNRVTFVTGATGVGKSTEIPKLFVYYSKAIDYNISPKVICTQPRKAPTENNASYVSTTLGVPIFTYDNNTSKSTNNFYVQMRHRDREHVTYNAQHSVLEYATDGSLILQINDPISKIKRQNNFTQQNLYDIIMIDEAHEHKINMDLLLTYLKLNVSYNNTVRLVILSATMDEDEPKYRRFYRDINDNRKFPLNKWIERNKLDRICVDRRLHISPPGMGTKFTITDIYSPNEQKITTINKILQTSTEGDILVFESGTSDINKLIKEINPIIPADVIAIPYYSLLPAKTREFVENISETKILLKIDKQADFSTVTDFSLGNNVYSRVIIVATNVAEASITIPSLKFVVETGTQKIQTYDYTKRGSKLIKTNISESSRIQRRGRVGRKSSGTVHYLYKKGEMEKNKLICEISTNNIAIQLFDKLKMIHNEKPFITNIHDPNKYNVILTPQILEQYNGNRLDAVLLSQYFINKEYYSYYGNDTMYDYSNYKDNVVYYESGFDVESLTDTFGTFYMIHPDESELIRNINGDIIDITNAAKNEELLIYENKKITSKKISSFWKTLNDYMYITNDKDTIVKTNFGTIVMKLFEDLKFEDHNLFRSIIMGFILGHGEKMLKLYSMYQTLQYTPISIFSQTNNKYNINMNIFKNANSDSSALLNVIDDLHNFLDDIGVMLKIDVSVFSDYLIKNTSLDFTMGEYTQLLGPISNYSASLKSKIISSNSKKMYRDLKIAFDYGISEKLYNNRHEIQNWCMNRNISYEKISTYLTQYMKLRADFTKKITNEYLDFFKQLKSKLSLFLIDNTYDAITISLLFGYPFNICKKLKSSNYYVSIYAPSLNNMYQMSSLSPYKFVSTSLISEMYTFDYLLYLTINIENNTINCLHHVTPKLFMLFDHIYSHKHFLNICQNYDFQKDKKLYKLDKDILLNNKNSNNLQNAIISFTDTLNTLKTDCVQTENVPLSMSDLLH